jgi:RHS repeat-associated protein
MELEGLSKQTSPLYSYLYNGKELDSDFGLGWYHYGARMYDATRGQFTSVDPIADEFAQLSPRNYASNDPIKNIDLHGLQGFSSISGAAWLAERQHPDKAKGLYQTARNYEVVGGAGTIVGIGLALGVTAAVAAPGAVATFVANEIKDEVLSQATGGLSDYADATKLITKGFKAVILESAEDVNKATVPYKRPNNATTDAQRKSVQGQPCVDCGKKAEKMVADHKKPLVKEYYETGKIDKTRMKEVDAVQPQCPTCSSKQGAEMSKYSKEQKQKLDDGN